MEITIYRREDFAGFWRRSLGNLIDAVFFGIIYGLLRSTLPNQWAEVTWLLIVWSYLIGFKTTINATPGFRLLKIKLVSIFPVDLTFWQIIVRSVTAVFSGLALGLGYFWAGFDRRKQTWHDKIAGTYVVRSAAEPVGTREVASEGLKRGAWCMAAFIAAFVIPLMAFTTFFFLIFGHFPSYLWQTVWGSRSVVKTSWDHYNRGVIYAHKGEYDQAIADYNKALELDPRFALAYMDRGVAYAKKGQYDQAVADYNKALEIDPRNAEAYNNRAVVFYYKKAYDIAWEDVRKSQSFGFKVDPTFLDDLRRASGRER